MRGESWGSQHIWRDVAVLFLYFTYFLLLNSVFHRYLSHHGWVFLFSIFSVRFFVIFLDFKLLFIWEIEAILQDTCKPLCHFHSFPFMKFPSKTITLADCIAYHLHHYQTIVWSLDSTSSLAGQRRRESMWNRERQTIATSPSPLQTALSLFIINTRTEREMGIYSWSRVLWRTIHVFGSCFDPFFCYVYSSLHIYFFILHETCMKFASSKGSVDTYFVLETVQSS